MSTVILLSTINAERRTEMYQLTDKRKGLSFRKSLKDFKNCAFSLPPGS